LKPTPCPSRLKELIALANLEPDSEARKHLKAIADAFRAKRKKQKPLPNAVQIAIELTFYVSLDGVITALPNEIHQTLDEIDREGARIELLRACAVCTEIFWAGRGDREACTRHAARWRQQEKRRRDKVTKEKRAKERVRRQQQKAEKPLKFSITTATICDAIFEHNRTTETILDHCYIQLHKGSYSIISGVYSGATVHRGIKLLVDAGYLNPGELQEEKQNRYYAATEKLKRLRREKLRDEEGGYYSFRRLVEKDNPSATR